MKNIFLFSFLFALSAIVSCLPVAAQEKDFPPDANSQKFAENQRPKLIDQLDLTAEQIQQIRRVNQEKKLQLRAAQTRLREANFSLDQAIYAETASETEIQRLIKEVQNAHAELISVRSLTELEVRKVLTPEQLVRFREIRQKFAERMNKRKNSERKLNLRDDSRKLPREKSNNRRRFPRFNQQ